MEHDHLTRTQSFFGYSYQYYLLTKSSGYFDRFIAIFFISAFITLQNKCRVYIPILILSQKKKRD